MQLHSHHYNQRHNPIFPFIPLSLPSIFPFFFFFSYFKYGVQCNSKWLWIPYVVEDDLELQIFLPLPPRAGITGVPHCAQLMCHSLKPGPLGPLACWTSTQPTANPALEHFHCLPKNFHIHQRQPSTPKPLYFLLLGNPQPKRESHCTAFWAWFLRLSMMLPRLVYSVLFTIILSLFMIYNLQYSCVYFLFI